MKSVLKELKIGLDDIRKFVFNNENQKQLVITVKKKESELLIQPTELEEHVNRLIIHYDSFQNKKILEYNTIIISLYGYFENYIEEMIKAYISSIRNYSNYFQDMPQKIIDNHSELSAQLIQIKNLPKYQNIVSIDKVIINMNSCITGNPDFEINLNAYTYHTSNFRETSINEFFSKVGIDQISSIILKYPKFNEYLNENEISKSIAFNIINDIADRRNQVAHGSVDNILSTEILMDYINFCELYCETLYEVLFMSLLEHQISKNAHQRCLNSPLLVYGRNVVWFNVENLHLRVGDFVYAKTNNLAEPIRYGTVQSLLNSENVLLEEIKSEETCQIGIEVDFKVSMNYTYYLQAFNELKVPLITA
jgi:hypothetical protein